MQIIKVKYFSEIPEKYTGIVEWVDGLKEWRFIGKLHRIDGPAIIYSDGEKRWVIENRLHRIDGPAVEYTDGSAGYWYNGKPTTKEAIELLNNVMKLKEMQHKNSVDNLQNLL
jgi:hypothetical protein